MMDSYDKCEYHATVVSDMKREFTGLQVSVNEINERLDVLNEQLNSITSIQIKNGGGMMVKASLADLMPILYNKFVELEKKIDSVVLSDDKVLKFVVDNAEKIIPIIDKKRKELDKENVEYSNIKKESALNTMNIMWYIVFFINIIYNIFTIFYKK